jgi:hypothetical protein
MGLVYNTSIVRDGLVLHLDAANLKSYPGTGTVWRDLSGNGNNGTLVNGVAYSSDNNGSLVFDGAGDYIVDTTSTNLPTGGSDRTILLWVYPTTDTNNFFQIGTEGAGSSPSQQAYIFEFYRISSTYYLYTDGINSANNITFSGDQLPDLNTWNFLIFGNSGQNWFYYKNALLRRSGTWPVTINTIGQQYVIGRRLDQNVSTFAGNISQASVYNRALTELEIQQNFEAMRGRYGI